MTELRTAAVLVPVYRDDEHELRVVLVVRADDGGLHGCQLGLPGGKPEPQDRDLLATALREAHEEVGLDPSTVDVVAELAPFVTQTTRWRVTRPVLRPQVPKGKAVFSRPNPHGEDHMVHRPQILLDMMGRLAEGRIVGDIHDDRSDSASL